MPEKQPASRFTEKNQSIDYGISWLGITVQNWIDSNDIDMPYWSETASREIQSDNH
mgnify:CR=1 FL=1